MAIHVVIKRKFQMNDPEKLMPLLKKLTDRASLQPGYISTDTLQSMENPDEYMVVSKWESAESWSQWFSSPERRELQGEVDSLIGERTFYELFQPTG